MLSVVIYHLILTTTLLICSFSHRGDTGTKEFLLFLVQGHTSPQWWSQGWNPETTLKLHALLPLTHDSAQSKFLRVMFCKSSIFLLAFFFCLQKLSIPPNKSKNPLRPTKNNLIKWILFECPARNPLENYCLLNVSPSQIRKYTHYKSLGKCKKTKFPYHLKTHI